MKLRSGLLVFLLLCWLIASSALAMEDQASNTAGYLKILAQEDSGKDPGLLTAEGFDCEWQIFSSLPEQDHSYPLISSRSPASFLSDTIHLDGSSIPDSSINSRILSSMNRDYFLKKDLEIINMQNAKKPETGKAFNGRVPGSDVKYIYERDGHLDRQIKRADDEIYRELYLKNVGQYSPSTSGNEVQFAHEESFYDDYFYQETRRLDDTGNAIPVNAHKEIDLDSRISDYQEWINKLAYDAEDADEDRSSEIRNLYDRFSSSPKLLGEISPPLMKAVQDPAGTDLTAQNLNRLVLNYESRASTVSSANSSAGINCTYIPEYSPSGGHNKKSRQKNYAIIIGIDEYSDRMSLHTCVNDANSIADLMRTLDYEVILLSDDSEKKPTKHNILDVALKEISLKQDKGNVIFYFSGHGMRDSDNTFYLIPHDSNGDTASYISEYELKQYIKDLDGLALIVDACDSEGLSESISKGQLMIASSKKNEASNEEWTGSLSVFTSKLIGAIREEGRMSSEILLQKCFSRAYNDTVKWGQSRFLRQTPVLMDLTGGNYYML